MSEALDGRTMGRTIDRIALWFGALAVVAAIAQLATGRWPDGVGALLSPLPVGAMAVRLRRGVRDVRFKNPRPVGMSFMAVTTATPGVIPFMVGHLVGGDFLVIFIIAIIGVSRPFIAVARSLPPTRMAFKR